MYSEMSQTHLRGRPENALSDNCLPLKLHRPFPRFPSERTDGKIVPRQTAIPRIQPNIFLQLRPSLRISCILLTVTNIKVINAAGNVTDEKKLADLNSRFTESMIPLFKPVRRKSCWTNIPKRNKAKPIFLTFLY